ncbi:MAG TPA: POTRA domain-containing protein, partial [Bacteroidales bacterium]|nr:POTRA domain-containing protein [Bacteroidales bacterium]
GVSMGSIIGGFYSLGYSADSLHKLLNSINWQVMLSNSISENKVIFQEKKYINNSLIALPLTSKKIILPSGLNNGQMIDNAMNYYLWPAADIYDFSKLPIPFMCVATDIISYKKVDLKHGYLPEAIRASFSVPSIFTPLKVDTMLLVDGGLIRNFAASEAREMGADILIGSYVGFKGCKEDELQSLSGILKQIAMYRSLDDFEGEKQLVKVIIKPDVDGYSITEFNNVDSLVKRGYKAALPYKEYFRKLADSLNRLGPQEPLPNILNKEAYTFDRIEVCGNNNYTDHQILDLLDIKPGREINRSSLNEKIEFLYGKAMFDKVKYRIVPRNDSLNLVIDCIEKPQAMLYGSFHYDNSLSAGIIAGISIKNLLTQRSVIDINSYISKYYRVMCSYLQFIDKNQKFGISADFYSDNTELPMLELRGEKGNVSSNNFLTGLSVNRRIGLNQMMSISENFENLNLNLDYLSNTHLENLSYNYLHTTFEYQLNTIDTKHFPDRGVIMNISVGTSKLISAGIRTDSSSTIFKGNEHSEFSFDRFYTLSGNAKHYFSPDEKLTIALGGSALWITDSDSITAQNNFSLLGGIESLNKRSIPMTGFHANEIAVKKMLGLSTEFDLEVIKNLHVTIMADIFSAQEVNRDKGFSWITGMGIGAGYMSLIGPIRIGIMRGNYDEETFFNAVKGYISIGYNF